MEITWAHLLTVPVIFDLAHFPPTLTQTTPNLFFSPSSFQFSRRPNELMQVVCLIQKKNIPDPWPSQTLLTSLPAKADWRLF
jgi:hypothetical protein